MNDKPKFEDLTRDIDWQRASFLKYCLDVTESEVTSQSLEETIVRKILEGYLVLALLFYKQFREDLKKNYEKPSGVNESDVKLLIQEAMDKLVEEWYRVYAIIAALRARGANKESRRLLLQMDPFVDEAMRDVTLSRETFPVILQFGQSYSLRFSNYSDNFAALSIPLWVLESPWEWTILWHELAGEKVRKLKNDDPRFFDSLLADIMNQLNEDQKAAAQEACWSTDWLEELFEDSFSVIHFPIHFLIVFNNLLKRYPDGGKGQRHPAHSMRLAMAMSLHLQMKKDANLPEDIQSWGASQWSQWTELEQEKNPERFKTFDPKKQLSSNAIDVELVRLTAEKIFQWHQTNEINKNDANLFFKNTIGNAIINYSRGVNYQQIIDETIAALLNIPPTFETSQQGSTDPASSSLCDRVRNKKGLLDNLPAELLAEHPQVQKLLQGLGYGELLGLSFSQVDFHNINDVHFLQDSIDYWVNPTTWHNACFDSLGNPKGKFIEHDPQKPLKLGFIEILEMSFDNTIRKHWQANPVDWADPALQKTK